MKQKLKQKLSKVGDTRGLKKDWYSLPRDMIVNGLETYQPSLYGRNGYPYICKIRKVDNYPLIMNEAWSHDLEYVDTYTIPMKENITGRDIIKEHIFINDLKMMCHEFPWDDGNTTPIKRTISKKKSV